MRVTPESPVQERDSYLYKWDTTARKYFNHFELHKQAAKDGLHRLFQNILTRNRDPIQYRHRFQDIDLYVYRQLLGDISPQEVKELNEVFGYRQGSYYLKSQKEPASLTAWKFIPLAGLWAFGAGVAGYGFVYKGYNILWLAAGFVPLWAQIFYNWARQPTEEIENCYKYLLAKRSATCEFEKNKKRFAQNAWANTKEFNEVQGLLRGRDITLYQLEHELLDKVVNGQLR